MNVEKKQGREGNRWTDCQELGLQLNWEGSYFFYLNPRAGWTEKPIAGNNS